MPRDPKRIKPFLKELERLWKNAPDLRFGQLIEVLYTGHNLFYTEDSQMLEHLRSSK